MPYRHACAVWLHGAGMGTGIFCILFSLSSAFDARTHTHTVPHDVWVQALASAAASDVTKKTCVCTALKRAQAIHTQQVPSDTTYVRNIFDTDPLPSCLQQGARRKLMLW